jgi:hypothetical protein
MYIRYTFTGSIPFTVADANKTQAAARRAAQGDCQITVKYALRDLRHSSFSIWKISRDCLVGFTHQLWMTVMGSFFKKFIMAPYTIKVFESTLCRIGLSKKARKYFLI